MDRILDINETDMVVTVEAGCTWAALRSALEPRGLRTPYWGTLSGRLATVGGSASQNSIFWGSGAHGSAADSLVSFAVVLADGSLLHTGSAAQKNAAPFFRHFGPDLTGLFSCDCGALGIKATVTLRLIPALPVRSGVSFNFPDHRSLLGAMGEAARSGLATEIWATDPTLTAQRARRERLMTDVKALAGVIRESRSPLQAIANALKLALGGRRFLKDAQWPMHAHVEDRTDAAAGHALAALRAIGEKHGGREIEGTIPKVLRANPFPPVNNITGPGGERWAPVHALVPLSKVQALVDAIQGIYARERAAIEKHGVQPGYLFTTIGHGTIAVEPLYFWPDELNELHERSVEPEYLRRLPRHEARPESRAFVGALRKELSALFSDHGASHLQIGKSYHYADALRPEALALLRSLKAHVDPRGLMNPGALGL